MILIRILILIVFLTSGLFSQNGAIENVLKKRLTGEVDKYQKRKRLTSLSFSLFRETSPGLDFAFGQAQNKKVKASPDHLYTWASVTKSITSLVTINLARQGYFSLNDSVYHFVESFPQNVTIKDLLNHTTGFLRNKENEHFLTNSSYKNIVDYLPIQFKNRFHRYANINYAVVAAVIEKATGKGYAEVVNDYFHEITGENIYFSNHEDIERGPIFARNYVRHNGRLYSHKPVDFGVWEPAAFAQTSSKALAKFLEHHLNSEFIEFLQSNEVHVNPYKSRSRRKIQERYALGFRLRYIDNELKYIYHNGFLYGVISTFYYFPDKNTGFTAVSNMSSYPKQWTTLGSLYKTVEKILDEEFNKKIANYTAKQGYLKGAIFYETIKNEGELRQEVIEEFANDFLKGKKYREAINLFELNHFMFSASADNFGSLAQAYMASGYHELAVENLHKGLQLDPNLESLQKLLKQLSAQ